MICTVSFVELKELVAELQLVRPVRFAVVAHHPAPVLPTAVTFRVDLETRVEEVQLVLEHLLQVDVTEMKYDVTLKTKHFNRKCLKLLSSIFSAFSFLRFATPF